LSRATTAAAAGALERLPDAAEEQLRQVLYAADSPVAVSLQEAFGEYLYDVPINDEITKRRVALAEHLADTAHAPPRAHTLVETAALLEPHILVRGNPGRPGRTVTRHLLTALRRGDTAEPPQAWPAATARLELARAIASRDNPLASRVLVNRVWAHHFGAGLVRTPSNFGVRGQPPTHPDLLDYLAARFMEDGWSIKQLHRRIMLSSTYMQSSAERPDAAQLDPTNRWLWKVNRRRLDFEALRDSLLAVAGRLDTTLGGPSFDVTAPGANRRSVYALIDRQALPGLLPTFDFASPDTHSPERYTTVVPQQALFLMNGPFVVDVAKAFAARQDVQEAGTPAERIDRMVRIAWGRAGTEQEIALALAFIASDSAGSAAGDSPDPALSTWEAFAQSLLLANEFIYVD
ncbi:MAG TPA: DUF1553 domain-containing protein, partial [Pirellulales bacterium]|nr:DUF1553 domain-containing protein [Pirellulales bacterium]